MKGQVLERMAAEISKIFVVRMIYSGFLSIFIPLYVLFAHILAIRLIFKVTALLNIVYG